MAVNKVEINGEVKLDLTQDTVTPENLLSGATAHNSAGVQIVGKYQSVTLTGLEITAPPKKTAYNAGETFDPAGMVVTATYSNGAKLENPAYTVAPSGALAVGTTTVTVTYSEGGITKTATQAISVSFKSAASASTSAAAGVSYTSGLSGLSAEDVTAFAEAISNNSNITNATSTVYVDFGSIHRKISVGDQVTLPLDGTNYAFDVIGFNHDALTTPTAYGVATATGKAGITFQLHDLFVTIFAMNDSRTNAGGWKSSKMRTSTMVTIKGYLPSAWQTAIKPVNKASGTGGGSSSGTETVSDNCFLLGEVEIFGYTTNSVAGEGVQYAYYKAGNSKIKTQNGSAYLWWERSPASGGSDAFCFVYTSGSAGNYYADAPVGVAFGFCV